MRVIVVAAWPPWLADRGDGSALILARHLRELGPRHEVQVLCAASTPEERMVDGGVRVHACATAMPAAVDAAGRRLTSLLHGEPAHVRWVARRTLRHALAAALTDRPDVVHLHGWGTAALRSDLGGVPAVHHAVDPWAATIGNRRLPAWRRWAEGGQAAAAARHERRHYPHLHAVAVVADQDAELLRRQVPSARVVVVPNGVDVGPPPAPFPDGGPVLVFHGSYGAQANVEAARALVHGVLPHVRTALPGARAVLAGRGAGADVLRLAGPAVEVLSDVPDVRAVLDRAHVHVDIMTSGSGVKNKVLESLAAGRPVIGTPLALQGLTGSGGTVAVADAATAATAVVDLVQRAGALQEAGRAGRERVAAQSWAHSADAVERLWAEAAER